MRSLRVLRRLAGLSICIISIAITPAFGDSVSHLAALDTGTSKPENLFTVFADAPPLQSAQFEIKDLQKIFPDFQHQPYEGAGFNAVMLPFVYSDPDHVGDANEALALDQLISFDLDWSPGSYCSRHAFYVFQHDQLEIQPMQQGYTAERIASLSKTWHATHAIGGVLTRSADGYAGTLRIFTADGKLVFVRTYKRPRKFWDLLGDMDVDAMTFLDAKPSNALIDHLHQPRCKHAQSLIDLGSTAFMPERSPGAFDIYEKILAADPVFAAVRAWYAGQKYVRDRNYRSEVMQDGLALSSRLEPNALVAFSPRDCPDQELASQYGSWLNIAAQLASEDSPLIIQCRLSRGYWGSQNLQAILERGLKAAAKYPNSHYLVKAVAYRADDAWMSASLLTSSLLDRYTPGFSDTAATKADLASYCSRAGRDDIAMELLSGEDPRQRKANLYLLLEILCHGGQYSEAADFYKLLGPPFISTDSKWMAPNAAFAAAVTGNTQLLDQILKDQHEVLALENLDDVFQAYRDAMDGTAVDPAQFLGSSRPLNSPMLWNSVLIAYCDAKQGTSRFHDVLTQSLYESPVSRLLWIVQDNYQRRDPSFDAAAFYDYLTWFFPDDPWVIKANADFRKRGDTDKPIYAYLVRADLRQALHDGPDYMHSPKLDWNHAVTPWRVVACVHQLLKQNKLEDATSIARMYRDYESMGTFNNTRHNVACELLHKVDLWKAPG